MFAYDRATKEARKRILRGFLETGRAPEMDEIARETDLTDDQLSSSLRKLEGGICLIMKGGDIYSFPPFANYVSRFPITVDGEQRWFAECAMESTSPSFMFPGREVTVNSECRYSGEPIEINQKDGMLLSYSPVGAVLHVGLPLRKWPVDPVDT